MCLRCRRWRSQSWVANQTANFTKVEVKAWEADLKAGRGQWLNRTAAAATIPEGSDLIFDTEYQAVKAQANTYFANVFFFLLLIHQSGLRFRYIHASFLTLAVSLLWVVLLVATAQGAGAWEALLGVSVPGYTLYFFASLAFFNVVGINTSFREEFRRRVLFAYVSVLAAHNYQALRIQDAFRNKKRNRELKRRMAAVVWAFWEKHRKGKA